MKKLLLTVTLMVTGLLASAQIFPASKFGKGFRYQAADSSFSMNFTFRMQSLFVGEYDEASEQGASNFSIRRSRLKFSGHVLSEKLTYKAELGLSNSDMSTNNEDGNGDGASRIILDAVLKYQFTKHWSLWFGQTKLPGNRERVVSSGNLQFVDRSNVNSRFNIDRDAGIQLAGEYQLGNVWINPTLAASKGEGRSISSDNYGGYDYTAHLDILPLGEFTKNGDYSLSDLQREAKPKIAFGFTYDYNDRAVRQNGQLGNFVKDSTGTKYAENTLKTFMADMIFKYRGFSVLSEYAIKATEKDLVKTSSKFNTGSGLNVQAGYLFKKNWEIAGRYTGVRNDGTFSGLKDQDEITLCFSKYFAGHNLKFQSDIARITTPGVDDGEIRFRMQVDMQF